MSDKIMLLPSDAPEPLEIYETPKVHPDNQKLIDERLARFRPLDKREKKRLERRRKDLWHLLNKGHYNLLIQKRHDLWSQFVAARDGYLADRASLKDADPSTREACLSKLYKVTRPEIRKLADQGSQVNHALADLEPLHQEYLDVNQRLLDHERILKEEAEERWQQKKFFKEAKIIEGIMLSTFARTKGCHHVWQDARGRHQMVTPKFQQSGSNADSHWFLLQTTIKERFGHRDVLPYGVDVGELVSERVTENLSVALGFQVEVRRSPDLTKIYYRVNRLDSPDGLPKYFAFQTMFQFYPERDHELLPFPLGVFDNRRVKWSNIATDPHILIAGKTQHGKSNYLNNIIATWIQFHSPQELRLILCDMKGGVEFTAWRGIPHLLGDFVKFEKDLLPRLKEARRMITERLALLEKAGHTDIAAYNRGVNPEQRLPRIVIVIDEMQTLLGHSKWTRTVHHHLSVIASQGRAPGVHLILCTQHPSKEVIPMPIKANMSLLVMFLMSAHSSLTLMQDTAPSRLPPRVIGRVVFASGLEQDEAQTAFIPPDDKASAARFAIQTYSPPVAAPLLDSPIEGEDETDEVKPVKIGLSEEDLIAVAVDNFDCELKARPMYRLLKTNVVTTEDQVIALVKRIAEQPEIEYGGVTYKPIKQRGNFYRLIPIAVQSETPATETRAAPMEAPIPVAVPELAETP